MPQPPPVMIALLLGLLPLQLATPVPADGPSRAAVHLAGERVRWHRALDAAGWDRNAPSVRATAESITAETLSLLERTDEVRAQAMDLLVDVSAEGLGAYLQGSSAPDRRLLLGYLRRHDDPALWAQLFGSALVPDATALADLLDLAQYHRASVALPLAAAVPSLRGYDLESVCVRALALPSAARAQLAAAVASGWQSEPADDLGPACALLGSYDRAGRARLATWIGRAEPDAPVRAALVPALFALAPTEQRGAAERAAARWIARASAPNAGWFFHWQQAAEPLSTLAPYLPLRTPTARALLARLSALLSTDALWLGLARLRARDEGAVAEALDTLRNPHAGDLVLYTALGLVGIAGGRTSAEVAEVRARMVSLREQLRAFDIPEPGTQAINAWIEGIERTAGCRGDRGCLVELLSIGSDAAAARAVWTLGPVGLGALGPEQAWPLVRRLVVHPDPWLLAAFGTVIERCPRSLRGAREAVFSHPRDELGAAALGYLFEFDRTCAEIP